MSQKQRVITGILAGVITLALLMALGVKETDSLSKLTVSAIVITSIITGFFRKERNE